MIYQLGSNLDIKHNFAHKRAQGSFFLNLVLSSTYLETGWGSTQAGVVFFQL